MNHLLSAILAIVGVIHLLPLSGALGSERLAPLYGVTVGEPNLAILMRHRAVLLGIVGLLLLWAAFHPPLLTAALVLGVLSVASFLWLAGSAGGYNPQLARVSAADGIALCCLLIAAVVHAHARTRG